MTVSARRISDSACGELEVVIGQRIAECVQERRIVGARLQQMLERLDRFVHVPGLLEDHGALVLDRGMLGMPLQRGAEDLETRIGFAVIGQQARLGQRQVELILGVIGRVVIQQRQRFGS